MRSAIQRSATRLAVATAVQAQVISKVVNAASFPPQLSPGCLAIISGSNLDTDLALSSVFPVTIAGKQAYVASTSPPQFIVQIPPDAAFGTHHGSGRPVGPLEHHAD
jgi:hypothetical protein